MSSEPTITLHWLETSRSQRILWLLEELGIDYNLKLYHRNESMRADPALFKVHPLGKSPVVEIDYHDGSSPQILSESGYIIAFLIKHFDKKGILKPINEKNEGEVDFYLHYAEGTLQPFFTFLTVHRVGVSLAPFFIRPIVSKFISMLDGNYTIAELKNNLNWLEGNLKRQNSGYFVGEKLSGADIILHFNIYAAFKTDRLKPWFTEENYPYLKSWLDRVQNRPKFKSAEKKIQVQGEGKYVIGTSSSSKL